MNRKLAVLITGVWYRLRLGWLWLRRWARIRFSCRRSMPPYLPAGCGGCGAVWRIHPRPRVILGIGHRHRTGRWRNNRAENSHQPTRRRERKMQGFRSVGFSTKIYLLSRSSPQHVQRSTPSHFSKDAPSFSSLCHGHMACGHCCSMSTIINEIIRVYRSTT